MDSLPPTTGPAFLSAEEGTQRLREMVEGFFFRRLLVKSPPGLGKTREAMEWATHYQTEQAAKDSIFDLFLDDITGGGVRAQVAIFVPRHELAHEIKQTIERNLAALGKPVAVPILRGRDHGAEDGEAPCRRWREARELGRKGLPVYSNLCRRSQERQVDQCPHFDDCDCVRAWKAAYAAPFVILVHSYLGIEWEAAGIVHGGSAWEPEDKTEGEKNGHAVPGRRFNPTHAAIIVCDEDPTQALVERWSLKREALRAITEGSLSELILAGVDASDGLLSYLHDKGVTPERLRTAAEARRRDELTQGQVTSPSTASADVGKAAAEAAPLVRLSRVLERLADELQSGRPGPAYSCLVDSDKLIAQGRRTWAFDQARLLVLDGTANPEIMRQFVPTLEAGQEIQVERNARVIQVSDRTFWKGSLIKRTSNADGKVKAEPTARLLEVGDFIEKMARRAKTLVVTNKPVRCALTGEQGSLPISAQYRGADVAHFGNLRGSNTFEGHDTVIILGRDEPSVRDAEQRAMAIWYDTKEAIQCLPEVAGRVNYRKRARRYLMRDGSTKAAVVATHPDPRVQAVVEQTRESEMLQAIDRLRLIHNEKRKTIYILCSIPLGLPVDELVTWKELTGDRRLRDALAECDAKGWDALSLAAKELTRLFPALWETRKAAEHWTAKNPPEANRNIIRVWGVLNAYRAPRQTRWSKALVRHGAEAHVALAKVLGVPTEDIRIR